MTLEILNKRSSALNSAPTPAQLEDGEIGVNYNADSLALYVKDTNGAIRKIAGEGSAGQYWDLTGSTLSPDSNTYGLDIGAGNIVLNVNGTAAFSSKVTSAATVAGDAAATLTTKGYVDGIAGGVTDLGISNRTATTLEVTSSTGTNATVPAATTTEAGLMTDAQFDKLDGISPGAQVNVQSDWTETDTSADSFIQNKPSIPTDFGVLSIIAGSNISISPATGVGNVTINATGGGGSTQIQWNISTNGSIEYIFDGPGFDPSAANPTLYVVRGQTYVFNKTVSGHPFQLQAAEGSGQAPYTLGVTGTQPIADEDSITWVVPMDAPTTLYYACTAHPNAMAGTINVLAPGGGGGGANIEVSVDPPGAPSVGDLWWDSSEGATSNGGRLYLYYGSQRVQRSSIGGGSGGGGDSLWTLNGTTLSPTNTGDGIALSDGSGVFQDGIIALTPSQSGSGYQFYVHHDEGLIHLTASDYNNSYFLADSTQVAIGPANNEGEYPIQLNHNGSITAASAIQSGNDGIRYSQIKADGTAIFRGGDIGSTNFITCEDTSGNDKLTVDQNGSITAAGSTNFNGGANTSHNFNTNSLNRFFINDNGSYFRQINTTANGANLHVWTGSNPQNLAMLSTSSMRYKTDVETIKLSYSKKLLNLTPIWFRSLCESDPDEYSYWGLSAEQVAEVDPRLAFYRPDPDFKPSKLRPKQKAELVPDGVQYDRFVPHLLNLIKDQSSRLEALEAEIQTLKGGNN